MEILLIVLIAFFILSLWLLKKLFKLSFLMIIGAVAISILFGVSYFGF